MKPELLAFDTETHKFQPGCATPKIVVSSWRDSVNAFGDKAHLIKGPQRTCDMLRLYLTRPEFIISGAKISFDFAICAAHDPSLLPLIFDAYDDDRVLDVQIALMLHLIAEGCVKEINNSTTIYDPKTNKPVLRANGSRAARVSLDVACKILLDKHDAKENDHWKLRYALLENTPLEQWPFEALQYPKDDAQNTFDCARELLWGENLRGLECEYKNQHNQSEQARAAFALELSSVWGLRTDKDALNKVEAEQRDILYGNPEKGIDGLIKEFLPFGLIDEKGKENNRAIKKLVVNAYSPNAPDCVVCQGTGDQKSKGKKEKACEACSGTGLDISDPLIPKTPSEGVTKDRDALEESGDELLEKFSKVSKVKKILQTYIPTLRKGQDHCINTDANVLLNTGRSSYSGLIQTMPRGGGLRECFVARPDKVFCSVDYNGVELVTLAQCLVWLCGKSIMADSLNRGLDLHISFASQMMGISYDEFLVRYKAGDPVCIAYRQAAKAANFGLPGGMGAPGLVLAQRKVGIKFCEILEGAKCGTKKITRWKNRDYKPLCLRCVEIATRLKDDWLKAFPEMERYFELMGRVGKGDRQITQFVSNRIRGNVDYCSAANSYFQGLAADGAKKALYRITKECYLDRTSPLYGSRVLIFIHDETFMEHSLSTAHDAAFRQAEIMVNTMREYTPDVQIKAEPALCLRWYKEAKAVYDESGCLIPWQPKEDK